MADAPTAGSKNAMAGFFAKNKAKAKPAAGASASRGGEYGGSSSSSGLPSSAAGGASSSSSKAGTASLSQLEQYNHLYGAPAEDGWLPDAADQAADKGVVEKFSLSGKLGMHVSCVCVCVFFFAGKGFDEPPVWVALTYIGTYAASTPLFKRNHLALRW
jgi:hypothetical protein